MVKDLVGKGILLLEFDEHRIHRKSKSWPIGGSSLPNPFASVLDPFSTIKEVTPPLFVKMQPATGKRAERWAAIQLHRLVPMSVN